MLYDAIAIAGGQACCALMLLSFFSDAGVLFGCGICDGSARRCFAFLERGYGMAEALHDGAVGGDELV